MKTLRGGRYTLTKTLGEGAQGETWEAVDKREGRLVAIKAFRVGKAKAWKDVELAEREARTLASLTHDRLPAYIEHFEEDGTLYLVMERIEGESLAALRKAGKVFGVTDVRRMLDDAARALAYLHGRAPPIVHRDLKPGNVLRKKDGSFAFVDFGSVRDRLKLDGGSTIVGTFGYMAPEQFQGRASPATDVFGIGATALAMLSGREPEDLPHKGLAIDVARAVPQGTPPSLVKALGAMLEPDPDKRAQTIGDALKRAATVQAPAPSRDAGRRETEASRREGPPDARRARLWAWVLIGLVGFGVLSSGLLSFFTPYVIGVVALTAIAILKVTHAMAQPRARDADGRARLRARVAPDILRRVRAVTPEQAQADAIREAERRHHEGDAEDWADREADFQSQLWHEPESWQREDEEERKREKRGKKKR
jgi:Protein kinase domain